MGEQSTARPEMIKRLGRPDQVRPPATHSMSGRVTKINAGQSHGLIRADDHREVFFHRNDSTFGIFNSLTAGDAVTFEVIEDRCSGPRATHVRLATPRE
jgi:cold shock CspA family protein